MLIHLSGGFQTDSEYALNNQIYYDPEQLFKKLRHKQNSPFECDSCDKKSHNTRRTNEPPNTNSECWIVLKLDKKKVAKKI